MTTKNNPKHNLATAKNRAQSLEIGDPIEVSPAIVEQVDAASLAGAWAADEPLPAAETVVAEDPAPAVVDVPGPAPSPVQKRQSVTAKGQSKVEIEGGEAAKRAAVAYEGDERTGSNIQVFGERPAGYDDSKKWRESSHRMVNLFDAVGGVKQLCQDNTTTIKVIEVAQAENGDPVLTSGHKFTAAGLESIWSLVGLNVATLNDLRLPKHGGKYGDIVVRMLNDSLRDSNQSKEVKVRLRQVKLKGTDEREWRVRAVKPQGYLTFDNDAFLNVILAAFPEEWGDPMNAYTPHVHFTGDDLTGTLIPEVFVSEKIDGEWGFGVNFGNSEVGGRHATTDPYTFRGLCFNGAIWRQSALSQGRFIQRHTGVYTYESAVRDMKIALKQGVEKAQQLHGRFEVSRDIKVADPQMLIVELAESSGLTASQGRTWFQGLMDTLAEFGETEAQVNVAHIANGLTRAAQMFKGAQSTRMQELAGGLLFADEHEGVDGLRNRFDAYGRRAVLNRTAGEVDTYLHNAVVATPLQPVMA